MPLCPTLTIPGPPCGCHRINTDGSPATDVTVHYVYNGQCSTLSTTCPITYGPSTFPHGSTRSRITPLTSEDVYPGTSFEKWPSGFSATQATFTTGPSARTSHQWDVNTSSSPQNTRTPSGFSTTDLGIHYSKVALRYTSLGRFIPVTV